ncbi:sulfotransferase family 2 domain-containing protein [Ruegeria faecimaris]|uniref:sulfotransferase family 2 domain-containing protein n=1 Tax=Ruegeria faecimaris TaxID=686389 RepID=UPI002330F0DB|nr:sulfotransferase family 2 domain-containing protein [Ruegeria faecimaris]
MVLVCHEHKFIYLKTTKTAGTSTEIALQPLCEEPGLPRLENGQIRVSKYGIVGARGKTASLVRPKWQFWRKYAWRNHMPAKQVRANLGAKTFDSYTKIANVRNPFDRAVSDYHFRKHQQGLPSEDPQTEIAQFKEFIRSKAWGNNWEIVSINNKLIVDKFVRKENLQSDLKEIYRSFGLPEDSFELPHEKSMAERRKGIPVPDYFDADTIDIVRRRMAWVFEAGNYPEDPQN